MGAPIEADLIFFGLVHVGVAGHVVLDDPDGSLVVDHSRLDAPIYGKRVPAQLLFDSNSSRSALSAALVRRETGSEPATFSAQFLLRGAGARAAPAKVGSGVMTVAGRPVARGPLVVLDLDAVNRLFVTTIDGVLGAEVFASFLVDLDYARGKLRLFEYGTGEPDMVTGETVALEPTDLPVPVVRAQLPGGETLRLILDTGSGAALFLTSPTLGDRLAPHAPERTAVVGLGGPTRMGGGRTSLALGPWAFENLAFQYAKDGTGGPRMLAALGIDGIIGPAVLWGLGARFCLDARNHRLVVHGVLAGERDTFVENRSGIVPERREDRIVIGQVAPRSPAAEAGLLAQEALVALGGTPLDEKSLLRLARAFSQPAGTRVTLTVEAPTGAQREVVLTLARYS